MKKSGIVILSVIIITILSIVQTILSNTLSTSGILMSKINHEIKNYKTENSQIAEKLFLASSFNNISARAKELGFAEGKSQFVLTSLPLALRQ